MPEIIDPFSTEAGFVDPFSPTGGQKPQSVGDLPKNFQKKAQNSATIAATYDIPVDQAFELHDQFVEQLDEPSLWDKAVGSFEAGFGDAYVTFGNTLMWAGVSKEHASVYTSFGERLKKAYIPPVDQSEFSYNKLLKSEWWATTVTRTVPFTLSLIPAAIVGAYAGTSVAAAAGIGTFGTYALGAIGGAVLSRPVESAFEAGATYEEAKQRGMSDADADAAATNTFKKNLLLVGLDAGQYAAAFVPMALPGGSAKNVLLKRILAAGGTTALIAASEGGEERYQELIQIESVGDTADFFDMDNPRLNEAMTLGGIFGFGLYKTGSVWKSLRSKMTGSMSDEVRSYYNTANKEALKQGATPEQAELIGLDAVADTEEGKSHIDTVISDLKTATETIGQDTIASMDDLETMTGHLGEKTDDLRYRAFNKPVNELNQEEAQYALEFDQLTGLKSRRSFDNIPSNHKFSSIDADGLKWVNDNISPDVGDAMLKLIGDAMSSVTGRIEGLDSFHYSGDEFYFTHPDAKVLDKANEDTNNYLKDNPITAIMRETGKEVTFTVGISRGIAESKAEADTRLKENKAERAALGRRSKSRGEAPPSLIEGVGERRGTGDRRATVRDPSVAITSPESKIDSIISGRESIESVMPTEPVTATGRTQQEPSPGKSKSSAVKTRIRETTGQVKDHTKTISERDALKASFTKAAQNARIAFRVGNKEGVAKQRAIMVDTLAKYKESKEKAALVKQVKKFQKKKGKIAVEYKKKISALVSGFDFTKPAEKKLAELKSLQEFLDKEGVPLGINPKRLTELSRLTKKPVSDLSVKDLTSLRDNLRQLEKIGRLKAKLKYKHNAQARAKIKEEITSTTVNLDPHYNKDSFRDRVKLAGIQFYLDTMQGPRVTDLADGLKGYAGPQTKLKKQSGEAAQVAVTNSGERVTRFLEFLQGIGVETLEEGSKSDIRMSIVMRHREGALKPAQSIMKAHGIKELPVLTDTEESILKYIQDDAATYKDDLIAAWEEVNDEIFPEQDVYFLPLKYIGESELISETAAVGRGRTTTAFDGFSHKRLNVANKVPRVGIAQLYSEHVMSQEWYKSVQPVIEDIKSVVGTEEYKTAAGEVLHDWWAADLDIMARRGWSSSAQMNAMSNVLASARHNMATAVLTYKISTVMMQPFAALDAMAYAHSRWGGTVAGKILTEVSKSFLIPGYAQDIIGKSEALKQREGGELTISEEMAENTGSGIKDKLSRAGFGLISKVDLNTAAGVQNAVEKILLNEGLSAKEALKEAEFVMHMTQASVNVAYRPHILASGEAARTWFTFQTFVMNRWGIIAHDLIMTGAKADAAGKIRALIGMGIMMMAGVAEDKARKEVYELISGSKSKDNRGLPEQAFTNVVATMPFFGQIVEAASRGREATPASLRTLTQGVKGAIQAVRPSSQGTTRFSSSAKARQKRRMKRIAGLMKAAESGLILGIGFPGTAQFFDLLESAIKDKGQKVTPLK